MPITTMKRWAKFLWIIQLVTITAFYSLPFSFPFHQVTALWSTSFAEAQSYFFSEIAVLGHFLIVYNATQQYIFYLFFICIKIFWYRHKVPLCKHSRFELLAQDSKTVTKKKESTFHGDQNVQQTIERKQIAYPNFLEFSSALPLLSSSHSTHSIGNLTFNQLLVQQLR